MNLDVTKAVASEGYYYAPDPSSQVICSIGGNVAENSGGAHCLKYGFTVHHVLGVEVVMPDGEMIRIGGATLDPPGLDLLGVLVGSEGTLAVVTKVILRLLRKPGGRQDPAGRFRFDRGCRQCRVGHHRSGHYPRCRQNDGSADYRGCRGSCAPRIFQTLKRC